MLSEKNVKLQVHEWLFMTIVMGLLASVLLASLFGEKGVLLKQRVVSLKKEKKIEVLVKGAVQHEGVYKIPSGMLLKDLLQLAGVLPEADLRRLKSAQPVERSRVLEIRWKKMSLPQRCKRAVKKRKKEIGKEF